MGLALLDKKRRKRAWPWMGIVVGTAVGLLVSILYLSTLAPGVLYYAQVTQDSPALQVTVPNLGISHPTGYPTYTLVAHLFTYLPVSGIAYRVNLVSAVFGVAAVVLLYLVGLKLTGRVLTAGVGALAFGVSQTFWSQAVIAEVYTLHLALLALVFLILLVWRERREDKYLFLAAFFCGLSMTNHLTSGLLIPAGLAFIALVRWRELAREKILLGGLGSFLIGLSPYVYLPLRASQRLPEIREDPATLGGFRDMVSGGMFQEFMFAFGPAELPGRLGLYGGYLLEQFPLALLAVGCAGAVYMLLRDRAAFALVGVVFSGSLVYALEYNVSDVYVFFLPTYLAIGVWVCSGLAAVTSVISRVLGAPDEPEPTPREGRYPAATALGRLERVSGLGRRAVWLAPAALALGLVAAGVTETYEEVDRSRDDRAREMIRATEREVPRGATVVHRRSPLMYMQRVEGRREDIKLWDFREPHTEKELAEANRALDAGRLYFLTPEPEMVERFESQGYEMVRVEGQTLYRATPARG